MEDKIRSLCTQILATKDDDKLRPILVELRDALHQHIQRLRGRLREYPIVLETATGYATPENEVETSSSTTTTAKP